MNHNKHETKEAHWNQWFAGLVDGDGTLEYSFKNGWSQLVIN